LVLKLFAPKLIKLFIKETSGIKIKLFLLQTMPIMKSIYSFNLLVLFFCIISCGGNSRGGNEDMDTTIIIKNRVVDSLKIGKIINPVFCQADVNQSYALYIPANNNKKSSPVVYFFDPHGEGALPLEKYKALADSFHYILIGSNNSKNENDWNDAEKIWNTLSNDSQNRLPIDKNRIYTCGFSGGAKVATFIALQHSDVKGVIANGAGLPDILNAGNFNFSFTAIAGKGDMNMTDLVSINNSLNKTNTTHRIIFFDGIHEWAPENTMNKAFTAIKGDAMRQKLIPKDVTFLHQIVIENKKEFNEQTKTNHFFKADEICNFSISILEGLTDEVKWFKEKKDSLANNPVYQKQWLTEQKTLTKEEDIKATYQQQFGNADMNYWKKTINDVKAKAKSRTSDGAMYQRLQAYLSLAFYSISSQLINGNKNTEARHFVNLYKLTDGTNSEAWYFSAILDARNKDVKATEGHLLRAVSFGFNDKKRLENQPEFKPQNLQINLDEIERKMK
jgi:predicted esterase